MWSWCIREANIDLKTSLVNHGKFNSPQLRALAEYTYKKYEGIVRKVCMEQRVKYEDIIRKVARHGAKSRMSNHYKTK